MSILQLIVDLLLLPSLCTSQESFFCDDFSTAGSNWQITNGQAAFNSESRTICNSNCMKLGADSTIYSHTNTIDASNKKSIYMQYNLDLCDYNTNDWDYFYIRIKINSGSWNLIKTYANGGCAMFDEIATFPSTANDASDIQIQFQSDTFPNTNAYVDNICLYGTPITITSVPTTIMPSTVIPTTRIPTTSIPTTNVPTTRIPTTSFPTTSIPTTSIPTTAIPTTMYPTTAHLTTAVPTKIPTNVPSTMPIVGGMEVYDISTTISTEFGNYAQNTSNSTLLYVIIVVVILFFILMLLFILWKYVLSKCKQNELVKKEHENGCDIQLGSTHDHGLERVQSVSHKNGENNKFSSDLMNLASVNDMLMDDVVNSTQTLGNDNLLVDDSDDDVVNDINKNIITTPNGDENEEGTGTDSNNINSDFEVAAEGNVNTKTCDSDTDEFEIQAATDTVL